MKQYLNLSPQAQQMLENAMLEMYKIQNGGELRTADALIGHGLLVWRGVNGVSITDTGREYIMNRRKKKAVNN